MTVSGDFYGNVWKCALNGEIDWDTDTIKVMLCTALTVDQDGDVYLADVTKTEVANGNGYTTGGATLTFSGATAIAYSSGVTTLDADDTVWSTSSISATHAIVYDDTPETNKPLIAYIVFGETFQSVSGTFTIQWSGSGFGTTTIT